MDNAITIPTTPAQVQQLLDTVKRMLRFLKALSHLTPTHVDDDAIAKMEAIVAFVEPLVSNPYFADVLDLVLGFIQGGGKLTPELLGRVKDVVLGS